MIARLRKAFLAQLIPLIVGFVVLAAIVVGLTGLIEAQRHDNERIRLAFEFQRQVITLQSLIQDAETSQRGYLLTGEGSYLDLYRAARNALPKALEEVRAAAAGNAGRRAQVDALSAAISDKLGEIAESISLYDQNNASSAIALVRSNQGKLLMDRIRTIIIDIRRDESAILQQRLANSERMNEWMRLYSVVAALAVLSLGVFGVLSARRRLEDVAVVQDQLSRNNKALQKEIATRELAEAQVRQMQKMEAIGQLTGGIAHDFNNMLAVIMSALNLMQRKLKRGESDIQPFVDAAVDATTRAANLTSRLLAFSRQQPLSPKVIDANRLVTGMSELLRRTLGEPIQIETVLAGGLWLTFVDVSQLENALLNLAVNGRDAMPEGGKLTIETANCCLDERYAEEHMDVPAGQYVLIAISDTGTGMAPEVAEKAVEPFYTTKGAKGTGLGLSQVFGFVKQSGGHLKIYSEPGQGTAVKIYLPRYFGDDRPIPQSRPARGAHPPSELILVVEDDRLVRAGTVASLRELGYRVLEAEDADDALRLLAESGEVALLLTDLIMPGTHGRKLASVAREQRPELKVLFTTGFTRNAVVHNGVLDHDVDFIHKPFSIDQLAAKIREVLDR
ncbi:CHASE3 domain-containing protein [Pseudaminobacter sp. 19-2017]|uniref:histidine kinase n=1 Tax=Pseudaminobacter soli (ex Zhang et al. 2022) TaxID=2831468 RepID=A0A942E4U8_9HYPH|nr:CHASE3 domain-containing protein [Pseudaminobacter soli]MBS3651188.1 CHASE3 domain-containing protein [Pseudaminobacter soli]